MANSTFIKPETYSNLTESQIFEWRKYTYNNLGYQQQFTNNEIMSLKSYDLPSQDELLNEISDQIKQAKILGILKKPKDNIVYIDSSTICKLTIPTILIKLFEKYPERKNLNNILIFSKISETENKYKFVKKYKDVNYKVLTFNMDLLTKKIPFKMQNVIIINTNLILDNKYLISEEISHLQSFHKWGNTSIKNEINDNAQILMMVDLLKFFKMMKGFIITHDKLMCTKVRAFMLNTPNLYIVEKDDM